jgi:hypothetical protein
VHHTGVSILRRTATVATVLALMTMGAMVVLLRSSELRRIVNFSAHYGRRYGVGGRFDIPPSAIGSAGITAIVFARSSCPACQASRTAFAQVSEMLRQRPGSRMLMVAVGGTFESELAFARDIGIARSEVIVWPVERTRLTVVPTLVVIDADATILFVHEGAQTDNAGLDKIRDILKSHPIRPS